MLKRNAAVVLVVGLVLGGAGLAAANGRTERPTLMAAGPSADPTDAKPRAPATREERRARREALRACVQAAGDIEARKACFAAAGVRPGETHRPGEAQRPGGRQGPRLGGPLAMLGRAVHGFAVVPVPGEDEGWQTVTFDRGTVNEATDGSAVVVDRPDGPRVTLALTADTKYHGVANAAAIVGGRPALVVSRDGKALHVVQKDPARKRPGNNEVPAGVPND